MECIVCFYSFDLGTRVPLVIPCGHTICALCINDFYRTNQLFCPYDRINLPKRELLTPNFDLVDILKEQVLKNDELVCCNNHKIIEKVSISSSCDMCNEKNSVLWLCSTCQYGICDLCKEWFESSKSINDPGFKCFRGHNLRQTQNPEKFYNRHGKFLCDGCKKEESGQSIHCRTCKVDYCMNCYLHLNHLIAEAEGLRCRCNKQLVWRYNETCSKCRNCRNSFSKSGAFICLYCKYKYCICCTVEKFNQINK